MSQTPSFSLITEPWISCELSEGAEALLSLYQVFDGSTEIIGLRGDSPTQDYAVLRVLLAIFWRAHRHETAGDPGETFYFDEWREEALAEARSGGPDNAVLSYLEDHADRFELLHPAQPFMQVADLHTSSNSRQDVSRIVPEAESDFFTMRSGDALSSLPLSEAARWLIHTQAYDYSGIKSGAVGDSRVKGGKGYPIGTGWAGMTGGTTVLGRSLRQTLVLNTTLGALDGGDRDQPVWEREPDGPAPRPVEHPAGAADFATWQSRRIRLFPDAGRIVAVLVSNGDRIPDAGANVFGDPMTPYRFSTNKSTKTATVYYPRPYDTNRMMWKSLEPLIAVEGDVPLARGEHSGKRPATLDALAEMHRDYERDLGLLTVRLTSASYGAQASSPATTVDARVDVPRSLLHEDSRIARQAVLDNARASLAASVNLGSFAGRLLVAAGSEYAFQVQPTDALLAELEPAFRDWLRRLNPQETGARSRSWQLFVAERVRGRAQLLLRGAGPKALIGREILSNDRPSLVTAGTAYAQLQRDLYKALPLTDDSRNDTQPPNPATSSQEETSHD